MAHFSASKPSMEDLGNFQNMERNLRRQMAKDHYYTVAKRWHLAGTVLAIIFALISPLVLLYKPDLGPLLGALAGLWIFMSRLLLEPVRQKFQSKGATAQELFDCDVLGLPWNDSLTRQPSEEEIRMASRGMRKPKMVEKYKDWYPTGVAISWPRSVITCQRSNAVWARRQHHTYGIFLIVAAAIWATIGIVIAILHVASLAEYLTTIALPSLPALLDATELAKKHLQAAAKRQVLEDETNRLFNVNSTEEGPLRGVQDQLFNLRRDAPIVAGWFYWLVSKSYEVDMKYAAEQRSD